MDGDFHDMTTFACRLDVGHIDAHRAGCGDWNTELQWSAPCMSVPEEKNE